MHRVTDRELQHHVDVILDRVTRGESLTVTRDGRPIADLRPVLPKPVDVDGLLDRWRRLPYVDTERFRADVDGLLDTTVK